MLVRGLERFATPVTLSRSILVCNVHYSVTLAFEKRFMKFKFEWNFCVLAERGIDFCDLTSERVPDASSASSPPNDPQMTPKQMLPRGLLEDSQMLPDDACMLPPQ